MIRYEPRKKKEDFPPKLSIYYNSKLNEYTQNAHKYEIFSNYSEISSFSKIIDLIYLIYLYRKNIHRILYDYEKNLYIENKKDNRNLFFIFYLSLLIRENPDIINYQYSFDYIDNINQHNKNKNDKKKFKKIIIAKIIIDLINNYKNFDDYSEENEENERLNKIEMENLDIIKNNIKDIKELNLDWDENILKEKNIDIIYIDIIKALFLKNNFNNIEKIEQILNQLELESINITNNMLTELLKILNDDFIKDYMIEDIKDLFNVNKINFYFILIKYIIKNSMLNSQIPFLLKTKIIIINLIKNKLDEFSNFNFNKEINNKIEYLIERITDSKYYYIKLQLKYIEEYYKRFFYESKREDINIIQENLNSNKLYKIEKYLIEYGDAQKFNERFNLITNLFEQKSKNIVITKIELKNEWERFENKIKQKKFDEMDVKDIIIMKYYLRNNKELFINIFNKNIYKSFINFQNNNNSINSISTNISLDNNSYNSKGSEDSERNNNKNIKEVYKQAQITDSNIESENQQSVNINENKNNNQISINNISIYSSNKNRDEVFSEETKSYKNSNNSSKTLKAESDESDDSIKSEKVEEMINSNYHILEFINIIGIHKNSSENIIEMRDQKILSYGGDSSIFIYDNALKKIQEINCKDWINSIEYLETKNSVKFNIVIGNKELFFIKNYFNKKEEIIKFKESKIKLNSFFKSKNENNQNNCLYFLCQENKVSSLNYALSKIIENEYIKILDGYYKEGIQINKSLFAFTSNKIAFGGKDKITFYNSNTNKCVEIKNNSFILTTTGLCLMSIDKNNNNNILLCACKKYIKGQKNGILLISDLKAIEESYYDHKNNIKFYNTKDFEVHCFCQISKIEQKEIFNKPKIEKTNYFFVGGFDTKKNRGGIKLYKIKKNKEKIIEIEKLQDIILKNEYELNNRFKLFKGPISCIKQIINGKLLITCWDGNVYLFNTPDFEKLISFETNKNSIL